MKTSKTIAALLGPTLIASAMSILIDFRGWSALVDQAFQDPALIFVTGYLQFVAGLAIVHFHNRWEMGWPVVVTATGWLAVLGGLSRILFPTHLSAIAMQATQSTGVISAIAIITFLLGAFLSFKAYSRD